MTVLHTVWLSCKRKVERPGPAEFVLGLDGELVLSAGRQSVQLVYVVVQHVSLVVDVLLVGLQVQFFPVGRLIHQ